MAGFFSIFSKKNEENIVPMENTLDNKLLYWSLALLLPIGLIIGSIIMGSVLISEGDWGIAIGIVIILVVVPFCCWWIYVGFKEGGVLCPKCRAKWSIIYLNVETLSEKVIAQRNKDGVKHYRVGVEKIHWKCENCGLEKSGEAKYKREVK